MAYSEIWNSFAWDVYQTIAVDNCTHLSASTKLPCKEGEEDRTVDAVMEELDAILQKHVGIVRKVLNSTKATVKIRKIGSNVFRIGLK